MRSSATVGRPAGLSVGECVKIDFAIRYGGLLNPRHPGIRAHIASAKYDLQTLVQITPHYMRVCVRACVQVCMCV